MVFSSSIFLFLFLPIVIATYFLLPNEQARNIHLLVFSLIFYCWSEPLFLILMIISITINYGLGLLLVYYDDQTIRRDFIVFLAVLVNIGMLIFFKYTNFIIDNINDVAALFGSSELVRARNIVLPIGISFFTFHALSYVIDVYRRKCPAQKSWFITALYFVFFPQLIAGPIVRYSQIAWQFTSRKVTLTSFRSGLGRFIFGLGKKVIIANPLGFVADQVFALPVDQMTASTAWLGISCYTLQIYYDFSGYSDMAIGLARMFGFRFLENFRYPYISQSIREFWQRWHISLSKWLRDYVYIPLGGNRTGIIRNYFNLVIVFLLCGLWHGANWTFLFWGAYQGVFLVVERLGLEMLLKKLWAPLRHIYVLFVVMLGWVFFRAETLADAGHYLGCMFGGSSVNDMIYPVSMYINNELIVAFGVGMLFATPIYPVLMRKLSFVIRRSGSTRKSILLATSVSGYFGVKLLVLLVSAAALASGTHNPFIYFRF